MKFMELALAGAFLIDLELREDSRGYFARAFCKNEFAAHGLTDKVVQANVSYNVLKGTLRGLHYQVSPHSEVKMVRCTAGSIFDVVVDLRPDSPTYCKWCGEILSAENQRMLYVPEGFAHGYQTLEDNSTVLYMVSEFYEPAAEAAARWNDPVFDITWPLPNPILSEKDATHGDYKP